MLGSSEPLTAGNQGIIFNHMVNRHDKDQSDPLDGVYNALSAEIRRRILAQLRERPMVVAELAAGFEVSWPAISRHLRILEEEGLVERRKDGRLHRIHLVAGKLAGARGWLDGFAGFETPGAIRPAPAGRDGWEAARGLLDGLAGAIAVFEAALGHPGTASGPASYLAGVLRRRCLRDPGLQALLVQACRHHHELGTCLDAPDRDPAVLLELTFTLGQLAHALRADPRLQDLALAS
jgi:DNA-binding transcriptional ArsR family regulator